MSTRGGGGGGKPVRITIGAKYHVGSRVFCMALDVKLITEVGSKDGFGVQFYDGGHPTFRLVKFCKLITWPCFPV